MADITRRSFLATGAAATALFLTACASSSQSASGSAQAASASAASASAGAATGKHIIGVAVYDVADSEVIMFKKYLVDYIAATSFPDVQFVYSGSIVSEDQLLAFIDDVAALGGEGIMSFYNINLAVEVERCASHGMYHIVASGTVSDADFASVADNEYFIGAIGPGLEMEYNAGGSMVRTFRGAESGNRYFVMTGGAAFGNEMHYRRTYGILDALETNYGVDLGATKDLAAVDVATTITTDRVTVTLSPGYVAIDAMKQLVVESFEAGEYDVVLSTIPVAPILGKLGDADLKIAQVDCYSQDNQLLFASNRLSYLAGKYGSIIGPSFAAMYNAVTGHAADFRDGGKAFRIVQNFWASDSTDDFNEKYEFASNILSPAYNYEDLQAVCKEFNPDATLEDLVNLTEASSYEDARKRRS